MRVLVLRPEEQGRQSAQVLALLGHEAVLAPLFVLRVTGAPLPQGSFDAFVLTSSNAVAPLAGAVAADGRALPVFAVGHRTAKQAQRAGFSDTRSAGGNRRELFDLMARTVPTGSHLLLTTGEVHHADLPEWLRGAGFKVSEWLAYNAEEVVQLPEAAHQAVAPQKGPPVDAVLHYSPRSAEAFMRLATASGLGDAARAVTHLCLSQDVARPLELAQVKQLHVAGTPDEASLFSTLDRLRARKTDRVDASSANDPEKNPSQPDLTMSKKSRPSLPNLTATSSASAISAAARSAAVFDAKATEPVVAMAEAAVSTQPDPVALSFIGQTNQTAEMAAPQDTVVADETMVPAPVPVSAEAKKRGFAPLALVFAGLIGGLTGAGAMLYGPRFLPASVAMPDPTAALSARLDDLQKQMVPRDVIEAVDRKAAAAVALATKSASDIQVLGQRVAAPASGVSGEAAIIMAETTRQIADMTSRLGRAEEAAKLAAAPSVNASAPARLALAERIQKAIVTGVPFAADLKALASTGLTSGAGLAALEAVAAKGAPTQAVLLEQFRQVRGKLSEDSAAASAGLTERLMALADNIVRVRAVGAAAGTSPAALTQTIETALVRGDMSAALAAFAQLPEPARRAGEPLASSIKLRADAENLARKLADDAVAALGISN